MRPIEFNVNTGRVCLAVTCEEYADFIEKFNKKHAEWFRNYHKDDDDMMLFDIFGINKDLPYVRMCGYPDMLTVEEQVNLKNVLRMLGTFTFNLNKESREVEY